MAPAVRQRHHARVAAADTTEPGLPVAKSDGVARKLLRACGAKE